MTFADTDSKVSTRLQGCLLYSSFFLSFRTIGSVYTSTRDGTRVAISDGVLATIRNHVLEVLPMVLLESVDGGIGAFLLAEEVTSIILLALPG